MPNRENQTAKKARCRNCKKLFVKTQASQLFCKPSCRFDFHRDGKTPQAQIEHRVKRFMKTDEFKRILAKQMRLLQSANGAKPQATEGAEKSANI